MAIGADSLDIQRTGRNALLQMLNTVVKHVIEMPLVRVAVCSFAAMQVMC